MEPVLRAEHLKKTFPSRGKRELTAVEDVSFCLYPGEILGIAGESGSGKSTVARMVTRLTGVTDGRIWIDGTDITNLCGTGLRDIYRKIQMVFQSPAESFDPRRTLGDGIGECLKNAGMPAKERQRQVEALLEQCGLKPEFAARYPREVSGGQCQRAAIARALAIKPEIVVLDEATSALDVTVQQQMIGLLGSMQKEQGLSYLFISHNLALIQAFCDRVLVMYEGRVVEEGTPDEVICAPKEAYTRRLVDAVL